MHCILHWTASIVLQHNWRENGTVFKSFITNKLVDWRHSVDEFLQRNNDHVIPDPSRARLYYAMNKQVVIEFVQIDDNAIEDYSGYESSQVHVHVQKYWLANAVSHLLWLKSSITINHGWFWTVPWLSKYYEVISTLMKVSKFLFKMLFYFRHSIKVSNFYRRFDRNFPQGCL